MTEVFLGREALGDGMRRSDLRRWYRPIYRGVYVPKRSVLTLQDRAMAAWLTSDRRGVVAGVAASALHGAEWVDADEPVEILVKERRKQVGLIVRMDEIAADETTTIDDIPVTTPARTAFDLGRHLRRDRAIARLDALMRAAPFDMADATAIMRRYGPVRGVRQLRDLLPLVDPGAASPKESWLRLLLIDDGLPAPETQIPILDERGEPFAFVDMGWRSLQIAVEYDGDQHRTSRTQYVKDMRRLERIRQQGWEVIRVIAEDRSAAVRARVREAYVRRGGAEIDAMSAASRTSPPVRSFGRDDVTQLPARTSAA